jgi:hypothetical protein
MTEESAAASSVAGRLVLLALVAAVLGLPINELFKFALLLISGVVAFTGIIVVAPRRWITAIAVVACAVVAQFALKPVPIEEGHNVFLAGEDNALVKDLPPDVYRMMAADFDALYPPARRCERGRAGCWRVRNVPDRVFAFSADGILDAPTYSRRVYDIDFDDPLWLRLGFINDLAYNWTPGISDVPRQRRDGRFWMGLHRWHILMPYFVMYRFPADYVGGQLCWRGDVIWEERNERFTRLSQQLTACRTIEPDDVGRRIFGLGIRPGTLAMSFDPPDLVMLRRALSAVIAVGAVGALLAMLVRLRRGATTFPFLLIGAALVMIAIDDASFIGGVRPFDSGDDGLFYDGVARKILRHLLDGNIPRALEGGEKVFYYGGPGLRYLRAMEHVIFGETYLGYLTAIILLPLAVFALFGRFMPRRWAVAIAIVFVAIPVTTLFGTSFVDYAKWASRGFADPASVLAIVSAVLVLIGPDWRELHAGRAFGAALLFALAIFIRPNVAPFAGMMLGGTGLALLYLQHWRPLVGLCIGFLPVTAMALHNWYFGGMFVPFSANSTHPIVFVMPPSVWLTAGGELMRLDFGGAALQRAGEQLVRWLSGPSQLAAMVPLHAAAVAVLAFVVLRGGFSPWLRLIAAATLAQHAMSLFYIATPRYHLLSWLMTLLVTLVWWQVLVLPWLRQRYPDWWNRAARQPLALALASLFDRLEAMAGKANPRTVDAAVANSNNGVNYPRPLREGFW